MTPTNLATCGERNKDGLMCTLSPHHRDNHACNTRVTWKPKKTPRPRKPRGASKLMTLKAPKTPDYKFDFDWTPCGCGCKGLRPIVLTGGGQRNTLGVWLYGAGRLFLMYTHDNPRTDIPCVSNFFNLSEAEDLLRSQLEHHLSKTLPAGTK